MTVRDLIAELEQHDEDSEVRLATQPSWPFEWSISNIVAVDPNVPDEGDPVCWLGPNSEELHGVVRHTRGPNMVVVDDEEGHEYELVPHDLLGYDEPQLSVVYVAEGEQLGYLPGVVSQELCWR